MDFANLPAYLMRHQREGVFIGLRDKRHLYANDTGTGKTVIGIELHRAINKKTLVVCPLSIIEPAWMTDLSRFYPETRAVNLWRESKRGTIKHKRVQRMKEEIKACDICIVNFESFRILQPLIEDGNFDVLMIDESSRVKNPKAKITKALIKYSDKVDYCFLFSGTPAPNTELEYWTQVRMISDVFGTSYWNFRGRYFFPTGYGGYTWKPIEHLVPDFRQRLASCSSAVTKEDVLDLPERLTMRRDIMLNTDERRAYKHMLNNLYVLIEDEEVTAANAAVKCSKLRQISSGFIIGEHSSVINLGNSKLSELMDLLDDIGRRQVIIWTQFQHEASQIVKTMSEAGKPVGRIDGTVPQRDKELAIKCFKDGSLQYLVAHPRSMGHGQTLTNCTDMIYYSVSYSLEEYLQTRDRIYRYGQQNKCSYYFLIAKDTVEEAVMKAVARKKDIAADVIDYIKAHGVKRGRPKRDARPVQRAGN